ncbi:MAG: T9SS type A sorting domain-containing protein [Flavobacteriales bacterium]|nr:T9SS type A sorting domain-containing protein [Flavobacteriales bacterium]
MKHLIHIIAAAVLLPTVAVGQGILFDEPHLEDGAIFLNVLNGKEVISNSGGQMIEVHPVFGQPMHTRKAQGLTIGVSAPETSQMKQSGFTGPTFNLTYLDVVNGSGEGFDDPTSGPDRRAALEAAFAYFASSMLDGGEADIEIRASFSGNPNSNPFAFSGAYYFGSRGFNDPFTKRHITTGNDPYGAYPDGYIQFNFHSAMNFHYDAHGLPLSDQYDFYTVALHEIMHLLGFASYCNSQGESAASPHVFTTYDGNLVDFEKNPLLEVSGSGNAASVSKPTEGVLTNDQVWFELGPGRLAPVFSPASFNGSSLSHFDNGRTEHGTYVMHPSLSRGQKVSHLHEDEIEVLEVIGYGMDHSIATSMEDEIAQGPVNAGFSALYPNPVGPGQAVRIDSPQLDAPEILVIVYDMVGRESYSKVILNPGPGPVTAIDPYHNLPPGMYVVVGSSSHELFNQKLVIR